MKLATEFYKLPLRFDVDRLVAEVEAFGEKEWRDHPQGFEGNTAIALVSANGRQNDAMSGKMLSTGKLKRCPYIQQVLSTFDTVIGRSRLMRLDPGAEVSLHCDMHYYWHHRVRVHIPIITDQSVEFICNDHTVNMAAGEAWVFDNWKQHKVINPMARNRIHLVLDTVGSAAFWELAARAEQPVSGIKSDATARFVPYDENGAATFKTELVNAPVVMDPAELTMLADYVLSEIEPADKAEEIALAELRSILTRLCQDWRCTWAHYGTERDGWPVYRALRAECLKSLTSMETRLQIAANTTGVRELLTQWLDGVINPSFAPVRTPKVAAANAQKGPRIMDKPVIIVAAPRSGSTLLFETLSAARSIWTIDGESHGVFEGIPALNPANRNFDSNRLTADDVTSDIKQKLTVAFVKQLVDADGRKFLSLKPDERSDDMFFLEKTPKNALRIPFLAEVFPNARFVFLHRAPRENISAIMDAWKSGGFVTYPRLPEWQGLPWSLLLPEGWRELSDAPLEEVATFQWRSANMQILDDLAALPADRWCSVSYEGLLADQQGETRRLCDAMGIAFDDDLAALTAGNLPHSRYTLSAPDPDKWRKHEAELARVLPELDPVIQRLAELRDLPGAAVTAM